MTPTAAELLRDSGAAEKYVDPRIIGALQQLTSAGRFAAPTDTGVLAVASLGTTTKIVDALLASGALPKMLSESDRDRLARRIGRAVHNLGGPSELREHSRDIAAFLGLPLTEADVESDLPTSASAGYPLFAHQRKALREVRQVLTQGGVVLLHMPTGSGKTRTAMNAVCDTLRADEGKAVLWIATGKELLAQSALEFQRAWRSLGDRDDIELVHAYGSRDWELERINDGIVFVTPQTLRSRHDRMMAQSQSSLYALLARKVSLLVFDEAHQSTADTYREVLEGVAKSVFPNVPVLGLSATPGRTYLGSAEDADLVEIFDGTKVTLDTSDSGYDNPVDYLIGNGYLAEPEFRILGEIRHGADARRPPMATDDYLYFAVSAVLDLIVEGHIRIIVFARSVEESESVAAVLRAAGFLAASVNGITPADERDSATRDYRAPGRNPRILVNFGVFTAGFDAPRTSAVVIARPVRSLVAYSQMVGRGIRGIVAGGNRRAVIATVVDPSEPAYGDIAEAFINWNTMWK